MGLDFREERRAKEKDRGKEIKRPRMPYGKEQKRESTNTYENGALRFHGSARHSNRIAACWENDLKIREC